jgi:CheY-like chemotaxis protein
MGAKRALVVDDSKSARVFLSRILEKYEIEVDNAENAEAAIEYLGSHRPDVIFMDHMMPGMDGFQAVQAIKNNPRTATIPIMMYTSQEGELYLGQARALGAVGVMPKQIKPADVSKVLYQLHLVQDRRNAEQESFQEANLEAVANDAEALVTPIALTDTALREHFADLRRTLVASIDTQSERITSDVRMLLQDAMPNFQPLMGPREARAPWIVACIALVIALGSAGLWWHEARARKDLENQLAELKRATASDAADAANAVASGEAVVDAPLPNGDVATTAAVDERKPVIIPVPYGDDALSGSRLETLRQMVNRLVEKDAKAVVEVRTFGGRYCLVGNATEGFSVAPDDLPYARCSALGNPHEDAAQNGPRESLGFANLANDVRFSSHGAIRVQLSAGDAPGTAVAYPAVSAALTAGEWNRAATANNRIEVRVR